MNGPDPRRWRALNPDQEEAIRRAWVNGAPAKALADAYRVHVRTIYRTLKRAAEPSWDIRVGPYRATFQIEADRPVQVTPWVAV